MKNLFGSISATPGKTGTYYYSEFFKYYDLDAEYRSFKADNLCDLENFLKNEDYSGFNVSMPFKLAVTKYLSFLSPEVSC